MHTIVLCSVLPCEIGAAALYQCLDDASIVVEMKIPDAKNFDLSLQSIRKVLPAKTQCRIIMVGTYWADCLDQLTDTLPKCEFIMYCFGESLKLLKDNLKLFSGKDGLGPTKFLFDQAQEQVQAPVLFKLFEKSYGQVMKMIDDRIYNRNIIENQAFYTGLFNYDQLELPLFDKFIKLFQGEYDLGEIIKCGNSILSAQLNMAKERVIHNSKTMKLTDGTLAVVTEAPELVNLTHDVLHQKYPDAKVTLILNMKFNGKGKDELAYSIRSFDIDINAANLAKKVNGDGNQMAAGGRVQFEFPMPF